MAAKFVNVDRQTRMLLPCDLREWVKDNDLVHFVLEVVEGMDMSGAAVNERGTGSRQYPPSMMLALLIYCYATGAFSSRQIERATYDSMAVRYICANHHPDHDTIASFRRRNMQLVKDAFVHVLQMARQLGLLKLGTLSVDGTKIKANARITGGKSLDELERELKELEGRVGELLERAEHEDHHDESCQGTLLPGDLGDASKRVTKLKAARQQLEARLKKLKKRREQARSRYRQPSDKAVKTGRKPNPETESRHEAKERSRQKVSLSDPESHRLPDRKQGFIQGFNGQAGVCTGSRLVVATHLSNEPNDRRELRPVLGSLAEQEREGLSHVLIDSGYWDSLALPDIEELYSCRMLSPPTHGKSSCKETKPYGPGHPRLLSRRFKKKMTMRLRTRQGAALYAKRASVSEGVFATIKRAMGFEEFRLRGLEGATLEWNLVTLAYNCRKMVSLMA